GGRGGGGGGAFLRRLLGHAGLGVGAAPRGTLWAWGGPRRSLGRRRLPTRRRSTRGALSERSLTWRGIGRRRRRRGFRKRWLARRAATGPSEVVGSTARGWNRFAFGQDAGCDRIG